MEVDVGRSAEQHNLPAQSKLFVSKCYLQSTNCRLMSVSARYILFVSQGNNVSKEHQVQAHVGICPISAVVLKDYRVPSGG